MARKNTKFQAGAEPLAQLKPPVLVPPWKAPRWGLTLPVCPASTSTFYPLDSRRGRGCSVDWCLWRRSPDSSPHSCSIGGRSSKRCWQNKGPMEAESFQNNNRYFWMKSKTEYSNELRQGALWQKYNDMSIPDDLRRQVAGCCRETFGNFGKV